MVFEGHGHSMEGPHKPAFLLEECVELFGAFERIVEKNLGQAARVSKGARWVNIQTRASLPRPVSERDVQRKRTKRAGRTRLWAFAALGKVA